MSSILPPTQRIWWKQPLDRVEGMWIGIALLWCLIMFFMMPYWHVYGKQNVPGEAYRISPEAFQAKAQAVVDKYTVRTEGESGQAIPVVKPPAGSDIYLVARLWSWWPIYELEKNQTYRLHISSLDWQHGFSLQPVNINLQVHPGYEMVAKVTPDVSGKYAIICNEYCGIGHHLMVGRIYVVDKKE